MEVEMSHVAILELNMHTVTVFQIDAGIFRTTKQAENDEVVWKV